MAEILDLETWRRVVVDALSRLGTTLAEFLPSLIGALLLVGLGWAISRAVQAVADRTLARLGVDRAAGRLGATEALRRAGVTGRPSELLARLLFWILMLTFVLSAVEALGLTAVTATLDRLIAYLPNAVAAALLLLVGLLLGRFARNVVGSGAAAAGMEPASRLGAAAQTAVVAIVVVLALEQLGIETALLVTLITAAVAGLTVTMGVAFALGAREVVAHILAGHFLRQSLPQGREVEVGGRRGVVERVGAVDTLFRDEERSWSVPNGRLLDETVIR